MAGTVEHLAFAWELLQRWENTSGFSVEHPDAFVAGNVCPDGIQARKNYERSMKKHTHFRDDIPDEDFGKRENLDLLHHRIQGFCSEYIIHEKDTRKRELYLGYLTHILTDEHFMLTIRPFFISCMKPLGLTQFDKKTYDLFTEDVNENDFRLVREYPGMDQIHKWLMQISSYEIPQLLTGAELDTSRQWILRFFFEHQDELDCAKYYTYEKAKEFIRETSIWMTDEIRKYIE